MPPSPSTTGRLKTYLRRLRPAIVTAALLMVVLGIALSLNETPNKYVAIPEGAQMPKFQVAALDAPDLHSESLHQKLTVIDFWATWCPPCRQGLHHLQTLQEEFTDRNVTVVPIHIGRIDEPTLRKFVTTEHLHLPIYIDRGALKSQFNVTVLPTTLIVSREGKLIKRIQTPIPYEDLRRTILANL